MVSIDYRWSCVALTLALVACGGGSDESMTSIGQSSDATEVMSESARERETTPFHEANGVIVEAEEQTAAASSTPGGGMRATSPLNTALIRSALIDLGPPPSEKLNELSGKNLLRGTGNLDPIRPKVYQIGFTRPVPALSNAAATAAALLWEPTATGGQRTSIQFRSEGARRLRVGMRLEQPLPANARVRVQGEVDVQAQEIDGSFINDTLAANQRADGVSEDTQTFWLPGASGATATLEIELPAGISPSTLKMALPQIAHGVETAISVVQDQIRARSACPSATPDATCSLPTAANAINASASYDFLVGGFWNTCSGTLISDKQASSANFFLTAHHCVSNQTMASTVQVFWFNRSSSCNGDAFNPGAAQSTVTSATYLFGQSIISGSINNPTGTDTALLRLPNGSTPGGTFRAGWSISRQSPSDTTLTGIHHPAPDSGAQKATWARRSDGRISGYFSALAYTNAEGAVSGLINSSRIDLPQYQVSWNTGITEPGSSGSALFRNANTPNPQVVGQLFGGNSTCAAPNNPNLYDLYGRFDIGYEDGMINWLNPGYSMVFRMYNTQAGVHFYTADVAERNNARQNIPALQYEGTVYTVSSAATGGRSPVFRFLNLRTGTHFYTISPSERDQVIATNPNFSYEGIAWYAAQANSAEAGTIPVYRFYLPSQGTHFYTANEAERDNVIATLQGIYIYEGVGYRAWPRQ